MSRILLVDDDESFRKMLRITLGKMGHQVVEAPNGKEALKLFQDSPPDLVMTDLIMPEKEGLETIRELRRSNPMVKIIAMSGGGRVNPGDFLKVAKILGANTVLAKPFTNEELTAALRDVSGGTSRP